MGGGGMYRQPAPEDLHHQPVRPLQPRGGQILASLPHVQHLGEEAAEGSPKPHQARTATAEGRDRLLWGSGTSLQAPDPLLPPPYLRQDEGSQEVQGLQVDRGEQQHPEGPISKPALKAGGGVSQQLGGAAPPSGLLGGLICTEQARLALTAKPCKNCLNPLLQIVKESLSG